jgi:dCTP deaminase
MSKEIQPYIPDLDKIADNHRNLDPLILSEEEYDEMLADRERYGLRSGRLSDKGILKAMEAGLIKTWDPAGNFDLLEQVQPASLDLRLGTESWHFVDTEETCLTLGEHREPLERFDMLAYTHRLDGEKFVFHPSGLVLSLTQERFALSNVVIAHFDGKSTVARLGVSNHQTAGSIEPGFYGAIMMEVSNSNRIPVGVKVGDAIASIGFSLLSEPSTRPRNFKSVSLSQANGQVSPFGYRKEEWDRVMQDSSAPDSTEDGLSLVGNGYTRRVIELETAHANGVRD